MNRRLLNLTLVGMATIWIRFFFQVFFSKAEFWRQVKAFPPAISTVNMSLCDKNIFISITLAIFLIYVVADNDKFEYHIPSINDNTDKSTSCQSSDQWDPYTAAEEIAKKNADFIVFSRVTRHYPDDHHKNPGRPYKARVKILCVYRGRGIDRIINVTDSGKSPRVRSESEDEKNLAAWMFSCFIFFLPK